MGNPLIQTTLGSFSMRLAQANSQAVSVLQTQGPGSPRSSPGHGAGRQIPAPVHSDSAGTTPTHAPQDSLMGVGGDVQEAFALGNTGTEACACYGWMLRFWFLNTFLVSKVPGGT